MRKTKPVRDYVIQRSTLTATDRRIHTLYYQRDASCGRPVWTSNPMLARMMEYLQAVKKVKSMLRESVLIEIRRKDAKHLRSQMERRT